MVLLPFIPKLIKGEIPNDINIYILYLLNLGATVLSYWLFAYKNCLLNAHQRVDILSKISLLVFVFQYILQFIAICYFKNYYIYLIVSLLCQVLTNIITAVVVTKFYPEYKPKGKLDKNTVSMINNRIRDLFTGKIGGVIVNSVDTVVISAFLGLTVLAIYQNYFYILIAIVTTISIILSSCTAGIGNSIVVETEEKNYNDFKKFTLIIIWIAGFCTCSLLCLYQPFMKIWVGKDLLIGFSSVVCFCIYFFFYELNQFLNLYKDAAGVWHEDRFRPLVTALSNLAMNLIMVQFWGLNGVLLSTIISTVCIGMPWLIHNLFTTLFSRKYMTNYVKKLCYYFIITVISCVITGVICSFINLSNIVTFIVRGAACIIIPNIIFFVSYKKLREFSECVKLIDRVTKGKFKMYEKIYKHKKLRCKKT